MAERDDDRRVPDEIDPDAPASAEEVAASERLRDALAGVSSGDGAGQGSGVSRLLPELELALSLRAAWQPEPISEDENRAVLDATPSAEEQLLAAQLRSALEQAREPRDDDHAGVHLAEALRMAFAPKAIDAAEHRAIVERALTKVAPGAPAADERSRRGTVVRVAFGFVAGGLALAASVVFVVTTAPPHGAEAPLAKARTTQPLFNEPFRAGESSARIDRIASARASDLRDNRFSKWGVR